jgi:hypothetical protein
MSPKKIIRLKTPLKSREEEKQADSSFSTHVELRHESTILKVDSLPYSESLQVTLINEINKLYKEIAKYPLPHAGSNSDSARRRTRTRNSSATARN